MVFQTPAQPPLWELDCDAPVDAPSCCFNCVYRAMKMYLTSLPVGWLIDFHGIIAIMVLQGLNP